jgi:hypothetical protein
MFHVHRHKRTHSNFTPPRPDAEFKMLDLDGSYLVERVTHGFTTIIKTCVCGDEQINIVVGDARLPSEMMDVPTTKEN